MFLAAAAWIGFMGEVFNAETDCPSDSRARPSSCPDPAVVVGLPGPG